MIPDVCPSPSRTKVLIICPDRHRLLSKLSYQTLVLPHTVKVIMVKLIYRTNGFRRTIPPTPGVVKELSIGDSVTCILIHLFVHSEDLYSTLQETTAEALPVQLRLKKRDFR